VEPVWRQVASDQAGVIARRQLLELGLTPAQTLTGLQAGRWHRAHPGVYATFTGPLPPLSLAWAAVLYAGAGAAAAGWTALWLAGLPGDPPEPVAVVIPADRKTAPRPGVRISRSRNPAMHRRPAARPPRVRVEAAVLDLAARSHRSEPVVDLLTRVCQHRSSTPGRLGRELAAWTRHRWRPLLEDLLEEVADGAQSALERRYLHAVERAHGLPRGERNRPDTDAAGARCYRDVRHRRWGVVVELDGALAHPGSQAFRDRARDNRTVRAGDVPLRYGWREVSADPCGVAAEVGGLLSTRGWTGRLRSCGPQCRALR
jgi:hypothetical protein